jgi:hypothetical protein
MGTTFAPAALFRSPKTIGPARTAAVSGPRFAGDPTDSEQRTRIAGESDAPPPIRPANENHR